MIFGEAVEAADSVSPAAWIAGELSGEWGTVGALVPDRYASIVRVGAPAPDEDDWWAAYRDVFRGIAAAGARHTSTPDRAWFAVWEGYGFGTGASMIFWRDPPPDELTRRARDAERHRLRHDEVRRNAAIGSALSDLPRFGLPHREYLLLSGPVAAVTEMRDPNRMPGAGGWQHPDLFWPDDRRWFVATDVDLWSLYLSGDAGFVDEVRQLSPTPTATVISADPLVAED